MAQESDENVTAMQLAGFVLNPTANGRLRWTHKILGLTYVRQTYMTDLQWAAALHGARNRAALCNSSHRG